MSKKETFEQKAEDRCERTRDDEHDYRNLIWEAKCAFRIKVKWHPRYFAVFILNILNTSFDKSTQM